MSAIDEARATLLRTLEALEQAEVDLDGAPERVDVVVVYALGRPGEEEWHEVAGWSSTPGPKWAAAALMRRAADAYEAAVIAVDDGDDDDG